MVPNRPDWWRNGASLDMDFYHNRYMVSLTAPVTYTSLTQFITAVSGTFTRAGANETATGDPFYLAANQSFVSRASSATYIDSSGVMQTAAANVARADYDPLTLAYKGVLIEPARTNYISNSTMQWSFLWPVGWSAASYGVTPTVVASGTVSGMNYIDVQFLGVGDTVSRATSQRYTNIHFGDYVTTSGNTAWATSAYIGYVSGSYPSGAYKSARLLTALGNISGSYLGELNYAQGSVLNYTGALKRVGTAGTTTSSTAFVRPYFQLAYDQGEFVDLTLRFAAPQIEMGTSSTSFIPTTSAPVTRAADVYTAPYSGTYFDSTGTLRNAPANTPRLDYDPSTSEPRGVLIEEARTNYVSRSESGTDITSGNTNPLSFVTATNVLAPNGSGTMLKCVGGNGGSDICRWIINMAPATTYTVSLFMKLAERPYFRLLAYDRSGYIRSSSVNLQNGTIAGCNTTMPGSESIQSLSNGIYRVAMTFTTSSTDLGYGSYFDIRMVPSPARAAQVIIRPLTVCPGYISGVLSWSGVPSPPATSPPPAVR